MHADCFAGGKFETIVRDPILHTVYVQLHKSLCMWEELCTYTKGKIIHEQWHFWTPQDWLDNIVNFKTEKNWRQDAALRNTHLLLISIRQSGPRYHLEQSMGQKPINESRQMASKIKVVKIGQYTVFPRGVVRFFQIKENGKNVFFFGKSITNETIESN